MARIRSVKPELRTSLVVAGWEMSVRYFWVLLWGYLDDHGYGVDDPRLVKADCFPLDDVMTSDMVDIWMGIIAADGPLCRYTVDRKHFIHAVNWAEHQKPQHPKRSSVPLCPVHDLNDAQQGTGRHSHDAVTHEQGAGSREQGAGNARDVSVMTKTPVDKAVHEAASYLTSTLDCAYEDATFVADAILRKRRPANIAAYLRKIDQGDLLRLVADARKSRLSDHVARIVAIAREGPPCVHGERGGANLHPESGEPLCPLCRLAFRQNGAA